MLEDSSVSSAGTEKHDVTIPLEKSWEASASPVEVKHTFMTQKNKKVPRPDKSHAEVLKKEGVKLGNLSLHSLLYADDLAILEGLSCKRV